MELELLVESRTDELDGLKMRFEKFEVDTNKIISNMDGERMEMMKENEKLVEKIHQIETEKLNLIEESAKCDREAKEIVNGLESTVKELNLAHEILLAEKQNFISKIEVFEKRIGDFEMEIDMKNKNITDVELKCENVEKEFKTREHELKTLLDSKSDEFMKLESKSVRVEEELTKLKDQLATCENEIRECVLRSERDKNELSKVEEILLEVTEQRNIFEEKLNSAQTELAENSDQINELKLKLVETNEVRDVTNTKLLTIENELSKKLEIIDEMETQIKQHEDHFKQFTNLQEIHKELLGKFQILQTEIERSEVEIINSEKTIIDLEIEVNELHLDSINVKDQLSKCEIELATITEQKKDLDIQIVDVKNELIDKSQQISVLEKQLEESIETLKSKIDQVEQIEKLLSSNQDEIIKLRTERKQFEDQTIQLKTVNDNRQVELENVNEQREIAKQSQDVYEKRINELQNNLQIVKDEMSTLELQWRTASAQKDEVEAQFIIAQKQLIEKTLQIEKLDQELMESKNIEIELQSKQELIVQLETNIKNFTDQITDSNTIKQKLVDDLKDFANLRQTHDELVKEFTSLQATIDNSKEESIKLQYQIETYEIRTTELEKTSQNTKSELQKILEEKHGIVEQLVSAQTELSEKSQQINTLEKQLIESDDIVKSTITKMETVEKELTSKQEIIIKLETELTKHNERFDEITAEKQNLEVEVKELSELRQIHSDLLKRTEKDQFQQNEINAQYLNELETVKNEKLQIENELSTMVEHKNKIEENQLATETVLAEKIQEIEEYKEKINQCTKNMESIEQELSVKQEKITELETQLKAMEKNLDEVKIHHEEITNGFQDKIKVANSEKTLLDERIQAYEVEKVKLLCELDEMTSKSREYQQQLLDAQQELTTQESAYKILLDRFTVLSKENAVLENNNKTLVTEVKVLRSDTHGENENTKLITIEYEHKINEYQNKLARVCTEKLEAEKAMDQLKNENTTKGIKLINTESKLAEAEVELKELRERLNRDIQIFQAKLYQNRQLTEKKEEEWNVEREKLIAQIEEQKSADDRIKENRLEFTAKLEKMKSKMKTLYNEEMSKSKAKHDTDIANLQMAHQSKVEKLENHVEKLSLQIYQMNEKHLELQKENEFMKTKIRIIEASAKDSKAGGGGGGDLGRERSQSVSNMMPPQNFGSTNLRMDDEEGEVFNNTYLTDLKSGRFSPVARDSVRLSELQYRNSLMLPHLRSTYAAQYGDQDVREDDLKGPFDDSLSSLLFSGQRKKLTGATAYKRPGPPTPSKNAGRLSLGSDYSREILKESNENSQATSHTGASSKKHTPGKFKSLFSSSKVKDETLNVEENRNSINSFRNPLPTTSTPRRRTIIRHNVQVVKYNDNDSVSTDGVDDSGGKHIGPKKTIAELNVHAKWRQSKLTSSDSYTTTTTDDDNDNYDAYSDEVFEPEDTTLLTTGRNSICYRRHYKRNRRLSSIYGRLTKTTPGRSKCFDVREYQRKRSKSQRIANFNVARCSLNRIQLRKSLLTTFNCNPAEIHKIITFSTSNKPIDLMEENTIIDNDPNSFIEFDKLIKMTESTAPFRVCRGLLSTEEEKDEDIYHDEQLSTPVDTKLLHKKHGAKLKMCNSISVIRNRKIPKLSFKRGYEIINEKCDPSANNSSMGSTTLFSSFGSVGFYNDQKIILICFLILANILLLCYYNF